jgi:hypothetical protein
MKRISIALAMGGILLGTAVRCGARRVSVEGVGISIRAADKSYRYKDDHLDTTSFDGGLIFPNDPVPTPITRAMEYATHDFRPANEDPRTNDRINRIKADAVGDLLIAMPSADASTHGWVRLTPGPEPDFRLNRATRSGKLTPDSNSPYWFYKHSYTTPGEWAPLPTNSADTIRPPFVFAMKGELCWENPPAFVQANAVTIAVKRPLPVSTLANPNLIVMSNGDYLAGISGAQTPNGGASLWKSSDKGNTWRLVHDGFDVNRYSLFELDDSIYLLGMNTSGPGETRIYRSSDGGATWTTNVFAGYGGQDAPSQVDIANGRIWKSAYSGRGPGFFSAPIDADLMKESSWTLSIARYGEFTLANGQKMRPGNELSLIKSKTGVLYSLGRDSVYRPEDGWKPGVTTIQPDLTDLTKTTWDPEYAGPRLPGNENGKCTARYDPVSGQYWALTSGTFRRRLNLYSASDVDGRIGDFQFKATILRGNSFNEGFNYPFMQFDGDDLIFVSRTAWETHRGTADRWHNGNLFTFHRVTDFRRRFTTTP